jgi:hypothetical protein
MLKLETLARARIFCVADLLRPQYFGAGETIQRDKQKKPKKQAPTVKKSFSTLRTQPSSNYIQIR